MLLEKDISRVNIGTFIVKVLKQRGKKNEIQCGWVHDLKTIENFIDLGVERVLVDTSKVSPEQQKEINLLIAPKTKVSTKLTTTFAEQLSSAKTLFARATIIQQDLLRQIADGDPLELDTIKSIIAELSERVFENCEAFECILNFRNKSRYQIEHAVAVTILVLIFSHHLELDSATTEDLAIGAFVHDIGKVFVDESILNKVGDVSAVEFEAIKSHVNQSVNIIKSTYGVPKLSHQIVAQHHEKLDGSGYPKGFDSRVISRYARMLTICDIYDALTSSKIYKPKQSQIQAFATLLEMANDNLIDQELVNRFIKCLGVFPVGSIVKLSTEQLAIVESRNAEAPLRPIIRVLYNVSQKHFINSMHINLLNKKGIEIERVVDPGEYNLDINKIIEFVILDG